MSVHGILVALWCHDSGYETLVVADPLTGDTMRVVCAPGIRLMPSCCTSIGDLIRVLGEMRSYDASATLYTSSDRVWLLERSGAALEFSTLLEFWYLFEGDRVSIRGVLISSPEGSLRLQDPSSERSVALSPCSTVDPSAAGSVVTMDCILRLDEVSMIIVLDVVNMTPAP